MFAILYALGMAVADLVKSCARFEGEISRRVVFAPAAYYNRTRPYSSLRKDAPLWRAIERIDEIAVMPILGTLHHQYFGFDIWNGQVLRVPTAGFIVSQGA